MKLTEDEQRVINEVNENLLPKFEMNNLNINIYKQSHEDLKKLKAKMIKFALDNICREDLIKHLKKKKIIKQDWNENKETYVLCEEK